MKKHLVLLASVVLVVTLFQSCTRFRKNEIGLVSRNFGDEIEMTQNLTFTFNKDLVPKDHVGNWDTIRYIEFEPAVKGKFKWTGRNELIFSPAQQFEPSTKYKATLNKELVKKADNKDYFLSDKDKQLEFHTPYLALNGFDAYWSRSEQTRQVQIRLQLQFNYDVNPEALKSLLKISAAEKEVPFTIETANPSPNITVAIDGEPFGKDEVMLKVNLAKGLKMHTNAYVTEKAFEFYQTLPSRYELKIVDVESGMEDNKGFIRVTTSQKLLDENLSGSYSINPDVKSSVTLTENGLLINGEFEIGSNYTLTLKTSLKGEIGGVLKEDFTRDIFFGNPPPSISFINKKAIYLSQKGEKNVGVQIVSVPKVNLSIKKVYENNILAFLRSNRNYDYEYYEEDGEGYSETTYADDYQGYFSDVLVEKTIETKDLPKVKGITALNLNLAENNAYRGVYLVKVSSPNEYYLSANKLVSISDIGLMVKNSGDDILVFANSIMTAEPMGGVELTLVSTNNQSVYTLKTDNKGMAHFKDIPGKAPGFKIAMVTARTTSDFNFMMLDDTRVETSRYEVDGRRGNSSGFEAFVYGDRNIYRPGETVNFNVVVRNDKWESVGEVPLKIKLVMPNGKEYKVIRKTSGKQGAADGSILLDAAVVTGTYNLEVYNGNDVLMNSQNISVEEFMPDRIKVDVGSAKPYYRPGEKVVISATAMNLFGPPAADRSYEMQYQLSRRSFYPKKYRQYNFDIISKTTFEDISRQGTTNDKGLAVESFDIASDLQDIGVIDGKVYVTVFDETGRPVNRMSRFDIYTQQVFYGISLSDYYVGTNQLMQIPLIALNKDENPVNAEAEVEVIRFEWQSVVERYYESYRYKSRKEEKVMMTKKVKLGANGLSMNYVPPISGEYEIRIRRPGASTYTSSWFYAYSYGFTQNTSFEVSTEGEVLITCDKEKYNVGDKAKVLFKTPFPGKLLVTVERNQVYEHYVLNTDKKSAELELKVKDEFVPNAYITATLIRPLDKSNLPLTVAHGFAPLMCERPENRLPLEIMAVDKSRSKTSQTITVKSKPESDIEVTLAVVDEGILQIKNYKSPDPYNFFFQKRALEVTSHDLYALLFPELSLKSSSGGDGGLDLERRINPLSNTRVKLVAFWSGVLKTNSRGEASYKIDIPQFSGDLRIMAVAYKNKAFGSASRNMKVADPIVISTALPRFFSPGDEIDMPVNISNTTNGNASVTATVKVTGPLQASGSMTQTLKIPANKEGRTQFSVKALSMIGNGTITVSVQGLNEVFTEKTDITVRPSTSLLKTSGSGMVNGGSQGQLTLTGDFIPSTQRSRLVISKSPMVQFIKEFDYLLGYPHGCAEQTISKAFPQLYFADFIKTMDKGRVYLKTGENERNPAYNVQVAIRKVEAQQQYNGAITTWPGYGTENWWTTAYAGHFLIEAQKAGYEVKSSVIDKILEYLTYKSGVKTVTDYYYYDGGYIKARQIAPYETVYSLYVLAMGSKPNRSAMNYYKANQQLLTVDNRYMLASAFSLAGDRISAKAVLPSVYPTDYSIVSNSSSFYSPLRNMGIVLNTLVETDPSNPQVGELARQVSEKLKSSRYYSTQEVVYAFLGLGKLAKSAAASNISAAVTAGGKNIGSFSGADLVISSVPPGSNVVINTSGGGRLFYYWENEGISATSQYVEEDNYIRVRKTFYNRLGQQITNNTFSQNDLIIVKIAVASANGSSIDNVVITDMLPAGLEIENPRLTEERDMPWIKNRSTPEHFDVRDDRINYFTRVGTTEMYFYYMVRAVSKGTYQMGPVSADAMYNGEIHSYNGAGKVTVK